MKYGDMSSRELEVVLETEQKRYEEYKSKNLKYDMTRGKPAAAQLALSDPMMSDDCLGDFKTTSGVDCRNYGILEGIPGNQNAFFTNFFRSGRTSHSWGKFKSESDV